MSMLVGIGVIALALLAPPAGANYGRVTARIGCDGTVTWTASASSEGDAEDRANPRVLVEYRPMSGQEPLGDWEPAGPEGSFDQDGDFEFSGSVPLPDGADAADLRVTPLEEWGNGDPPGDPRFSRAELPEGCADHPVVASVVEDCAAGGARVEARNVGDDPHAVTVSADGVAVREMRIDAGATEELLVPLLEERSSMIRVSSNDFVVAEASLTPECGLTEPSAVVLERCASRQAVVYATLGGQDTGEIQVRVGEPIVHMADMESGTILQRTLELPPAGSTPIAVQIDGTAVAVGEVGGCDTSVAGAATCGVGERPACEAAAGTTTTVPPPPPPPPPTTLEIEPESPVLPRTGPWERAVALLLGGGLLLAGGIAAASRDRRRPVASPVASALAPYRQRWWDDT